MKHSLGLLSILTFLFYAPNVTFSAEGWLLDHRRCFGYAYNTTGHMLRLDQDEGVLLLDSIGPNKRASFAEMEQILVTIDDRKVTNLYWARRMSTGWYMLGVASSLFKQLRSGKRLKLSSVEKDFSVEVNLANITTVEAAFKKCHPSD